MCSEVGDPPRLTDGYVAVDGHQQSHPDGHRLRRRRQRPRGRLNVRHQAPTGLRHPARTVLYSLHAAVASSRLLSCVNFKFYLHTCRTVTPVPRIRGIQKRKLTYFAGHALRNGKLYGERNKLSDNFDERPHRRLVTTRVVNGFVRL